MRNRKSTASLQAAVPRSVPKRIWPVFVAVGVLATACASVAEVDSASTSEEAVVDVADDDVVQEEELAETTTTSPPEVDDDQPDDEAAQQDGEEQATTSETADELAEPEVQLEPILPLVLSEGENELNIFGGIQIALEAATEGIVSNDCAALFLPEYTGSSPFAPAAIFGRVSFSGQTNPVPISTIDAWLALYGDQPTPQATEETITFLGEELAGYRVEGPFSDGPPPEPSWLNCASGPDAVSELAFMPSPFADVFVAETDEGLLTVYGGAFTPEEATQARAFLDALLPTITPIN